MKRSLCNATVVLTMLVAAHVHAQPIPKLVTQTGHSNDIADIAFSPDGRYVITGGSDQVAFLWDVETGTEIRRFRARSATPNYAGFAAAFSADGASVVTATDTLQVWSVETGLEVGTFQAEPMPFTSIAATPDGAHLVTAAMDGLLVWSLSTGRPIRRLRGHEEVDAVAVSADSRLALTGSRDGTAKLWSLESGKSLHTYRPPAPPAGIDWVHAVGFSQDGRYVAVGSANGAFVWSVDGHELVASIGQQSGLGMPMFDVRSVAFTPDGQSLMTGGARSMGNGVAQVWSIETGRELATFGDPHGGFMTFEFNARLSPDGRHIVTAGGRTAVVWSVTGRRQPLPLRGYALSAVTVEFSPDGQNVLVGGADEPRVWSMETGSELRRFPTGQEQFGLAKFSADGRVVFSQFDQSLTAWSVDTGERLRTYTHPPDHFGQWAVSPRGVWLLTSGETDVRLADAESGRAINRFSGHREFVHFSEVTGAGRYLLTASADRTVLWSVDTGREVLRVKGMANEVYAVDTSADGRFLVTGDGKLGGMGPGSAYLWSVESGRMLQRFGPHERAVWLAKASPDGSRVLTSALGKTARVWSSESGEELSRLEGHDDQISSAAFSQDGRHVLTGSLDGTARLWDASSGRELARLISFADDTWVAVAPDGRFDTNELDRIRGLHWIMPDDPMRPLPLEIFMREYYEPRLLPRLMAGERFEPLPPLVDINRLRPEISIFAIEPEADGTVSVTVEVASIASPRSDAPSYLNDPYDVRVFRDGQLVAYAPAGRDWESETGLPRDEALAQWRSGSRIDTDPSSGKALLRFDRIRIPAHGDAVEFSAYAFNSDRVKSETARRRFTPQTSRPGERRAYIVAVGVNAFDNSAWDLTFAAEDARQMLAVLPAKLRTTGAFDSIVTVPLISDGASSADRPRRVGRATKANVRAAIDRLAGRSADDQTTASFPNAELLRPAGPDDLVLIGFSSHGYADDRGNFYLFPEDIGSEAVAVDDTLLERTISSAELTAWLRDVDAGDLIMIVDACYSATSIEGSGFKPAPMGSRGLGQLAYDKGMRILTATQARSLALESERIRQGLLSYALLKDGLEAEQADYRPRDRRISMSEWLSYSLDRVPRLHDQIRAGDLQRLDGARGTVAVFGAADGEDAPASLQRPQLFDFTARERDTPLANLDAPTN